MKKSRFVIATSLLALVAGVGVASAQPGGPGGGGGGYGPPPAPPPGVYRSGFIAGFSIGGGSMVPDCDGCDSESGVSADFHLGGMITPRLAIMWDGSGVAHTEDNLTLINAVNTAALQYWVGPKIWIKGGLGFGRLSVSDDSGNSAESESGAAVLGAAGVELIQKRNFALDASLRLAAVSYDQNGESLTLTNVSVNVGFNWY